MVRFVLCQLFDLAIITNYVCLCKSLYESINQACFNVNRTLFTTWQLIYMAATWATCVSWRTKLRSSEVCQAQTNVCSKERFCRICLVYYVILESVRSKDALHVYTPDTRAYAIFQRAARDWLTAFFQFAVGGGGLLNPDFWLLQWLTWKNVVDLGSLALPANGFLYLGPNTLSTGYMIWVCTF